MTPCESPNSTISGPPIFLVGQQLWQIPLRKLGGARVLIQTWSVSAFGILPGNDNAKNDDLVGQSPRSVNSRTWDGGEGLAMRIQSPAEDDFAFGRHHDMCGNLVRHAVGSPIVAYVRSIESIRSIVRRSRGLVNIRIARIEMSDGLTDSQEKADRALI